MAGWAEEEILDPQAKLDETVIRDLLAWTVNLVLLGLKEVRDSLDQREIRVIQGKLGLGPLMQVSTVTRFSSRVTKDRLVHPAHLDHRAHQEQEVLLGILGRMDHVAPLESKVLLVVMEWRDPEAYQEIQVKTVSSGIQALRDLPGLRENRVIQDLRVTEEWTAFLG